MIFEIDFDIDYNQIYTVLINIKIDFENHFRFLIKLSLISKISIDYNIDFGAKKSDCNQK